MSFSKIVPFLLLIVSMMAEAQEPRLMFPIGHTSTVVTTEFSPNGKKIITASKDKTAKIWDAEKGMLLADLIGHTNSIKSAVYSSDGIKILTHSEDTTVKVWDASTGKLLADIKGHTDKINSAQFSPDGKMVVTSSENTARLWDAKTGKQIIDFTLHKGWVLYASFSPDGKKIVTASMDRTAKIWDVESGNLLVTINDSIIGLKSAIFNPAGDKILAIGYDGSGRLWESESGKFFGELAVNSSIDYAIFSEDGKTILTVHNDYYNHEVLIWDALSTEPIGVLFGHTNTINSLRLSPDGKTVLTASSDNTFIIWDIITGKKLKEFKANESFRSASFSPNGKKVTACFSNKAIIWDLINESTQTELSGKIVNIIDANLSQDSKGIITYTRNSFRYWDRRSGKLKKNMVIASSTVSLDNVPVYSPDGKKILLADNDYAIKVWDEENDTIITKIDAHTAWICTAEFSPDGSKILSASRDNTVKIWDANKGTLIFNLQRNYSEGLPEIAKFSYDGEKIAVGYFGGRTVLWNAINGIMIGDLIGHTNDVKHLFFSPDSKYLITASYDGTVKIWDAATGKFLMTLIEYSVMESVVSIVFDPAGKFVVTGSSSGDVKVWDIYSGRLQFKLNAHSSWVTSLAISNDGKKLLTASVESPTYIWDLTSGTLLGNLNSHSNNLYLVKFLQNEGELLTLAHDDTIVFWDASSFKPKFTFFFVDSSEHFIRIDKGYYLATPVSVKSLHYVTKDLNVITFEQLDVKYNRPDKVLEAIGNTDTALIKSYRKAWEKRIKKLGIDTTQFRDGYSVPEADFVNRDSIAYEQKTGTLRLHIRGIDSTYKLDRFNVWVNESPLFGQRGISIKKKNSNSIDTTITIQLSQGENRIETSITNVNGTESYRMPLYVNYTPAMKQKEMIRFIGIGIDQFKESNYNLQYSSKDIRDLAIKLRERYKDSIIIDTLFNQDVTAERVKALKEKLKQTSVNDKVIVSYSGHGLLNKDYDYYLSTYAVNFNKPEENGLPYDELENLLDSIPARKKLMFIDACHSGEVDKEEGITQNRTADSLGLKKGIIIDQPQQQQHVGLKNSFELMQSLFVNVGKSTGATIISAAAGNQFALERGDLKNGVFTYSILEAMNKYPTMKISELKKTVGERVEQLTNGLQKPTSRNEAIAVDWSLW